MRIVLVVLGAWAGLAVVCGGLFVALVRGGGGTDLAPLPAEPLPEADVEMPVQRAPHETSVPSLEAAMPVQRTPAQRGAPARRRTRA